MIIDYAYCTGCKSCEISCSNEKELPQGEWGIKVNELGPKILQGTMEWDYLPAPSRLCDLCAERREGGQKAACELHCLADVIRIVALDAIPAELAALGHDKVVVFVP